MKIPINVLNIAALLSGLLLCAGGSARADTVIYDNLSSNNNGFYPVDPTTWDAQRFDSDTMNLRLTSATLFLQSFGGSGTFFVKLYSDQLVGSTFRPGVAIATLFDGTDPGTGNILFAGLNQLLMPDTNYWIVLGEDPGATFGLGWAVSADQNGTGDGFQIVEARTGNSGTTWVGDGNFPQIMQLTASAVPEPSTWAFVLGGLSTFILLSPRLARG